MIQYEHYLEIRSTKSIQLTKALSESFDLTTLNYYHSFFVFADSLSLLSWHGSKFDIRSGEVVRPPAMIKKQKDAGVR